MEALYERLGEQDRLAEVLSLRVEAGAESESVDYADVLYRLAKMRLTKVGNSRPKGRESPRAALEIVAPNRARRGGPASRVRERRPRTSGWRGSMKS